MKTFRNPLRAALLGLSAAVIAASPALAMPVQAPSVPNPVIRVAADCRAIGMQHASRAGGELVRAASETRGGQQVCVIVVKIPGQGGDRPRVDTIVVPAG